MTQAFERFLRSFSDEELTAFALERQRVNPPYWKLMQVALRIEASRRDLALDDELIGGTRNDEFMREVGGVANGA